MVSAVSNEVTLRQRRYEMTFMKRSEQLPHRDWQRPVTKFMFVSSLFLPLGLWSCGENQPQEGAEVAAVYGQTNRANAYNNGRKYELITPTGEAIMASSMLWETEQAKTANANSYAQPAQCARNVSKVLALSGLSHYNSDGVDALVAMVKSKGGLVLTLPKSESGIAKVIAANFAGKIPTGTLIAGCLYQNCGGTAGEGHVAMVGDINSSGAVNAYHNNWYRPDNEGGQWLPNMIPLSWYKKGYLRKWMGTPWMDIMRTPPRVGVPNDVNIEMPAIDDLDPTNYFVRLAVPAEILAEYKAKNAKVLDATGNQVSLK
jgi:hypothetical protein